MVIERVVIMANDEKSNTGKMRKLFADKTLDTEQMDGIVGGALEHCGGGGDDSRFLNVLLRGRPCQPERHNGYTVDGTEVMKAWESVGVKCNFNKLFGCGYSINGKQVTAEEAYRHAMKVVGKQLKPSDWYWD